MFNIFKNTIRNFLNILYPRICLYCEKIINNDKYYCEDCAKKLKILDPNNTCSICGKELLINKYYPDNKTLICGECLKNKYYFDKNISVFYYNEYISKPIISFKESNKWFLSDFFAKILLERIIYFNDRIDIISPIPSHINKLRNRHYNQSVLLVKEFKKYGYSKNIILDLLQKIKDTKGQKELNFNDRKHNLKDSFILNQKYLDKIKNKNILLIDDIFTTGSTLNECSKVLKTNGVNKVFTLTIAKT